MASLAWCEAAGGQARLVVATTLDSIVKELGPKLSRRRVCTTPYSQLHFVVESNNSTTTDIIDS